MPESSRHGKRKAKSPPRSLPLRKSQRIREKTEVEPDSYFCELCRAALDGRLTVLSRSPPPYASSIRQEHYQDFNSWRNAANDGCCFCAPIFRRVTLGISDPSMLLTLEKDFPGMSVSFEWNEVTPAGKTREPKHHYIKVEFMVGKGQSCVARLIYFLEVLYDYEPTQRCRTVAHAEAGLTYLNTASSNTPTEESWSCAKVWIEQCATSHIRCNALRDNTWRPSRLLDIQYASQNVWLVETHGRSISEPYATLSHRWPLEFQTSLILRLETYDLFCEGVQIVDLPQTVQDSITCCKNLSIKYLWVDCMCIIQNSENQVDWRRQASVMDKVYTQSLVNLSAVHADNTESSMFQPGDTHAFNGRVTTSIGEKLGHSKGPERCRVVNADLWNQNVAWSHINERAWILQERILSPRILHFGLGQLLWECCTMRATEDYAAGIPPIIIEDCIGDNDRELKNLDPAAQENISSGVISLDRHRGVYEIWTRIVETYSTCRLTKSSDKLIALSGIAKRVSRTVGDVYVAGMWQYHLPRQLFWRSPSGLERRSTHLAQYRAPSFSWAAIDEPVTFPSLRDHDSTLEPEIAGVHLRYETEDVFGAITGGHLTMRSHLYRLLLSPPRNPPSPYGPWEKGDDKRYKAIQVLRLDGYDNDGTILESVIHQDDAARGSFDEDLDNIDSNSREDLYCIPRTRMWQVTIDLLILQLVDREKAHYARRGFVGTGDTREDEEGTLYQNLQVPSTDPFMHYPCIAYDEGKHTIRLV